MPTDNTPLDAPDADAWDLPQHWTNAARDTWDNVLDERPDLAGAELSALEQACNLIAAADNLDGVAREASYVAQGSQGQTIVHPATVEARLARTAAAQILARLVAATSGAKTPSQRGRDAARARWSK
ncbi:hypothetical protein [Arthrobacter sp. NPDC089319]|uniref:hypothetical protein n=1 Tax=Arthrobacter sp. NPDC089319 TaxID=3155915 RepID=UPI00341F490C